MGVIIYTLIKLNMYVIVVLKMIPSYKVPGADCNEN
jgi:hypothetical protein